jgi:hypothetical protein
VSTAFSRCRGLHERDQAPRAADEQCAAQGERGRERDGGDGRGYRPLAFLISFEIAGTTSCKSPITP